MNSKHDYYEAEEPKDENAKVWRYLSFPKFVSLLSRQALFFSRVDMLDDPFEGAMPRRALELRKADLKRMGLPHDVAIYESTWQEGLRKFVTVSCWHLSEYESAAMWDLYSKSDGGIAVQSTIGRLKSNFDKYPEDGLLKRIAAVRYIDYETDCFNPHYIPNPYFHKRKSFEHERELRAIIARLPEAADEPNRYNLEKGYFVDGGIYVPVDLDILIEKVFVTPAAPYWIYEVVKDAVKRFGLDQEVAQSSLQGDPLY